VLRDLGASQAEIDAWLAAGVVRQR
jgi:hypothetical protein